MREKNTMTAKQKDILHTEDLIIPWSPMQLQINSKGQMLVEALFTLMILLLFVLGLIYSTIHVGARLWLDHRVYEALICTHSHRSESECQAEMMDQSTALFAPHMDVSIEKFGSTSHATLHFNIQSLNIIPQMFQLPEIQWTRQYELQDPAYLYSVGR